MTPLLSQEDEPLEALQEAPQESLERIIMQDDEISRALAQSIVRFLELGQNGNREASFRQFREAIDEGADVADSWDQFLGDAGDCKTSGSTSLPKTRSPWRWCF